MAAPANSISVLNSARRAAGRYRAEWLLLLNDEIVTPDDLLKDAGTPAGRPLLKLSLAQVLMSLPGWGRKRCDSILNHVIAVTGAKVEPRQMTVGWLLDPRAGGRRYQAWLDARQPKDGPPWPGFPYLRNSDV